MRERRAGSFASNPSALLRQPIPLWLMAETFELEGGQALEIDTRSARRIAAEICRLSTNGAPPARTLGLGNAAPAEALVRSRFKKVCIHRRVLPAARRGLAECSLMAKTHDSCVVPIAASRPAPSR